MASGVEGFSPAGRVENQALMHSTLQSLCLHMYRDHCGSELLQVLICDMAWCGALHALRLSIVIWHLTQNAVALQLPKISGEEVVTQVGD